MNRCKEKNLNKYFSPKLKFSTVSHNSFSWAYFPSELFIIKLKYHVTDIWALLFTTQSTCSY